jgi:type IV pilus assembly protein PilE
MTTRSEPLRAAGFTLIELMVTIVVASILVAIAVPTYSAQIRKSRRTEARTALMDLATREERYFSVNNSYTDSATALGYAQTGTATVTNTAVGSGYYTVTVTVTAAAAPVGATPATQAGFQIVAKPTGNQAKDTQCVTFTIDQTGTQASSPSTTGCWN